MKTDTLVFLLIFLEYGLLFVDDNEDEECEQFLYSKSSTLGCCI